MGKKRIIQELTNLLAKSLRHKIGGIVNKNEIYSQKYAKDAEILLKEAQKISLRENWNSRDKIEIKRELEKKLMKELEEKTFLDESKFNLASSEIIEVLRILELG
jgi:hypothetical protein